MFAKFYVLASNVNSATHDLTPTPTPTPGESFERVQNTSQPMYYILNDNFITKFIENAANTIMDQLGRIFNWIAVKCFDVIYPVIDWGSKILIVICIISFYVTDHSDKKSIATAIKAFMVYLLATMIYGAIH